MPCCRSESDREAISSGSNCRRGWNGFGSIWSTGMWSSSAISSEPGSKPPSSVPSNAARPRPRRLLFTVDDLHDEFGVGPGAPGPRGVVQHALAVARRLADVDVARDHGPEDRVGEEAPDLGGDL